MHVRYNSWCISLRSPPKQQREMTKFYVVFLSFLIKLPLRNEKKAT